MHRARFAGKSQDGLMGGTGTVLIVDDESRISELASRILREFGYSTLLADCGEKAVEIYRSSPDTIDLVIMDLGMPGMGGLKSMETILEEHPDARIIVSSGTNVEETDQALACGAVACLNKPYRVAELLECVESALK